MELRYKILIYDFGPEPEKDVTEISMRIYKKKLLYDAENTLELYDIAHIILNMHGILIVAVYSV